MRVIFAVVQVLVVLLAVGNVAYALRRGRIGWGRSFTKVLWAEREASPDLFWVMVGANVVVAAALIWLLLTGPSFWH